MMGFNNWRIRSKLIFGFITVAVFTIVIGVIGVINMKNMYENNKALYEENFLPTQNLKAIQLVFEEVRAYHVYALYDRDESKLASRLEEIDKRVKTTNELLDNYEKNIRNDDEQKLFDKIKENLLAYRTARNANIELIKSGDYDEALKTVAAVTDAREKTSKCIQDLADYNLRMSENMVKQDQDEFNSQSLFMIIVIIVTVMLAVLLGVFVARIISNPVNKMVEVANKLAVGDVNVSVEATSKDEIGSLATSFNKMIENIRKQALAAERIAEGDLTVEVDVRSENDLLGKQLSEMVKKNNEVLSRITAVSEQVAVGSRQVSDSSVALSQGATEQASSVEELTASLQEISSQTELNANNASQANDLAKVARNNAVQGNNQMKDMVKAMEEINESSANISKVIKVIDDIAFQTNILALNAAVEAARAGQHGKGFAVVAEEVRNLAARSANAAKETTDMIEGSIKKAEGGTRIAKETAEALNSIVNDIEKVANLVNGISSASNEQATGIAQINQGIMQVSQVVQTNSATSEESAAASEELSSQATLLKEEVSKFKLKSSRGGYGRMDELSPEVLMMLENMANNKRNGNHAIEHQEIAAVKPKIDLSDKEFGKY